MPLHTRETLPELLTRAATAPSQVYLLCGERYLCRNAAEQLEQTLLKTGGTAHAIDGDREDMNATLAKLRGFSLLPGRQVYRVTDTRLFHSKQVAKNIWERTVKAQAAGKPELATRNLRAFLESGGLRPPFAEGELVAMADAEWQHSFGFAKPGGDLGWTRTLLASDAGSSSATSNTDPAEMLAAVLKSGLPAANILILLAEEVDKRKKLFKLLKDEQTILDLSVESGSSSKAQKEQKAVLQDLVKQTLAEQGKSLAPGLAERLFDRVGFHPVAVVMELRKLMAYVGERRQITSEDLDLLVGRTRQEALFELTGAIAEGNLQQALVIGQRLQENGIHPLAVVATLRNFVRNLLLFRALLEQTEIGFQASMSAAAFQNTCLPRLKERQQWKKELSGHPFALYMQFKSATTFPLSRLSGWLQLLLQSEMRLKGSPLAAETVLQHLLLTMISPPSPKE